MNCTTADNVIFLTKGIFARQNTRSSCVTQWATIFILSICSICTTLQFRSHHQEPKVPPQSNEEAKRAVQTIKNPMKKEKDRYLALLMYRATLLQYDFSTSELLMARKLRTNIPMTSDSLKPAVPARASNKSRPTSISTMDQGNLNLWVLVNESEILK